MLNHIQLGQIQPEFADLLLCLVLLVLVFLFSYAGFKGRHVRWLLIILILLFLVFSYWETDYARYYLRFISDDISRYAEPFYYYVGKICFGSYYVYRLIIWGLAFMLISKTAQVLEIDKAVFFFVFSVFFLMTFSYARASLAMASYFLGFAYVVKRSVCTKDIIKGCFFILISYFFHRSTAFIILLTPFCFFRLNKRFFLLLLISLPIVYYLIHYGLVHFLSGDYYINEVLSSSVENYAGREMDFNFNWKFRLITSLRNYSFFVGIIICLHEFFKQQFSFINDYRVEKCLLIAILIIIVSTAFLFDDNYFIYIVGYRFLYFSAIPLVLAISLMYQSGSLSKKQLFVVLFMPSLYAYGYLIGKLLSV